MSNASGTSLKTHVSIYVQTTIKKLLQLRPTDKNLQNSKKSTDDIIGIAKKFQR